MIVQTRVSDKLLEDTVRQLFETASDSIDSIEIQDDRGGNGDFLLLVNGHAVPSVNCLIWHEAEV